MSGDVAVLGVASAAGAEEQHGLAVASRHLCPSMSRTMLDELHGAPAVHISHLKPGVRERIMEQLRAAGSALTVRRLDQGDVLEF